MIHISKAMSSTTHMDWWFIPPINMVNLWMVHYCFTYIIENTLVENTMIVWFDWVLGNCTKFLVPRGRETVVNSFMRWDRGIFSETVGTIVGLYNIICIELSGTIYDIKYKCYINAKPIFSAMISNNILNSECQSMISHLLPPLKTDA